MMNKGIIAIIAMIGVTLLLTGCNKKKSHFDDGGDLVCTKSHLFGKDETITINKYNSSFHSSPRPRSTKEGFYYGDSFFNISNTYFDIDNCEIR